MRIHTDCAWVFAVFCTVVVLVPAIRRFTVSFSFFALTGEHSVDNYLAS